MQAKAIARGEPFAALVREEGLKAELLQMIEWSHGIRGGGAFAPRHHGRGLDQWIDADVQARLAACWGRFGSPSAAKALIATMELYADLAADVARACGFEPPVSARVVAEVKRILKAT